MSQHGHLTTTPLRHGVSHVYGGRLLHTMDFTSRRTLCGRFDLGNVGSDMYTFGLPPTCKKCLNNDPRFTVQAVKG